MANELSHYDDSGRARMVDVSGKAATTREAEASAFVLIKPEVLKALPQNPKGDPLEVARVAGIMAAKRTSDLIPLCHPLALSLVEVDFEFGDGRLEITAAAETPAQTAVEMEARTAAAVAALAIYDMAKAIDARLVISELTLVSKTKETP